MGYMTKLEGEMDKSRRTQGQIDEVHNLQTYEPVTTYLPNQCHEAVYYGTLGSKLKIEMDKTMI